MRLQASTVAFQVTWSIVALRVLPKSKCKFFYGLAFTRIESKASLDSKVALLVSKPTKWLRLFFVPKHLVMLIIVYQANTWHRAASLYNESNAQNKFTFKCWSCHAFNVVHQLSSFWALCFAIFADEVVLLIYLSCKHFPEITQQYILFARLSLHFNPFCPARAT